MIIGMTEFENTLQDFEADKAVNFLQSDEPWGILFQCSDENQNLPLGHHKNKILDPKYHCFLCNTHQASKE
jgi:hypothetical protein